MSSVLTTPSKGFVPVPGHSALGAPLPLLPLYSTAISAPRCVPTGPSLTALTSLASYTAVSDTFVVISVPLLTMAHSGVFEVLPCPQ